MAKQSKSHELTRVTVKEAPVGFDQFDVTLLYSDGRVVSRIAGREALRLIMRECMSALHNSESLPNNSTTGIES